MYSKKCLINAQTNNFKEIYLAACGTHQKQDIYLFSSKDFMDQSAYKIDFTYQNQVDNFDLCKQLWRSTHIRPVVSMRLLGAPRGKVQKHIT